MSTEVRLRRGTTAQHTTFTGALAEVTVDTTKKTLVIHDGVTAGGFPIPGNSDLSILQPTAQKGQPNGYAPLGADSKVPSANLPDLSTAGRYQVSPTKVMTAPDGTRFVARGVQMFDYLLVSQEARTDYRYRSIQNPGGKGPGTGISEPTYYAKTAYVSEAHVDSQIALARATGANLIRLGVEPAVMFASVSYVDGSDGLTYPSDHVMLDTIVAKARKYGMAIQLQCSNDLVAQADQVVFLKWLTLRYWEQPHVWINPANEPNGVASGGANVADVGMWTTKLTAYLTALREDIPGQPAGTKFLNPVALDPVSFAYRLDLVNTVLTTTPLFRDDPNLVINIHYYPLAGETDFRGTRYTTDLTRWINLLSTHCVMIGEAGVDNQTGRLDPNLDAGTPSVNPTAWANAQASVTDFLAWCQEQCSIGTLQGVIGHMWKAWIPGLSLHDDNSMRRQDGTWTTWGGIFRDTFLTPRRQLPDRSVTNAKLTHMASATVKGRALGAGSGAVQDLTQAQISAIAGDLKGTPVSHASLGTPLFQAESTDGVRGAAMFIGFQANAGYIGFYNRGTSALVGSVIGNGSTGVTYGTTSDARLKTDVQEIPDADALAMLAKMRPIIAGWRDDPTAPRECMFLAHELQEVMPTAVTGQPFEESVVEGQRVPIYQNVDYGRITPVLTAALQAAVGKIEMLEQRLAALEHTT